MCPILDLANHNPASRRATDINPLPRFTSPPDISLDEGSEIYLKYGDHHNGFLFLHYGFICRDSEDEITTTVIIDDILEQLLEKRSPLVQKVIKTLLLKYRYWK
jgi:hypothetical protein